MTRILYERTGGFMGRKVSLDLDLDSLAPDRAETLRLLLNRSDFFHLPEFPDHPAVPDEFIYTLTVTEGAQAYTIRTSDTSASDDLRPLLEELSKQARAR
jgi:hypothetical protein